MGGVGLTADFFSGKRNRYSTINDLRFFCLNHSERCYISHSERCDFFYRLREKNGVRSALFLAFIPLLFKMSDTEMNLENALAICDTPAPVAKKSRKVAKKPTATPTPPAETATPPTELAVVPTPTDPPVENPIDYEAEYYRLIAENTRLATEIAELKSATVKPTKAVKDTHTRIDANTGKSVETYYWKDVCAKYPVNTKLIGCSTTGKRGEKSSTNTYYTVFKKDNKITIVEDTKTKQKYRVNGSAIMTCDEEGNNDKIKLMVLV